MNAPVPFWTQLDDRFFEPLLASAAISPRKRAHRNLHADFNEPVQRTCIALVPGTYIRPHCHPQANKRELILPLKGAVTVLIFDAHGAVFERLMLAADQVCGIELPPGVWHTVFPLAGPALILEVKQGPYVPSDPVCFADWSPEESVWQTEDRGYSPTGIRSQGTEDTVRAFLNWAKTASVGESFRIS